MTLEYSHAVLLGLPPGAPAFLVERIGFAEPHGRPVELRRSVIRGDRYRFRVRLEGPEIDLPGGPAGTTKAAGGRILRGKGPRSC